MTAHYCTHCQGRYDSNHYDALQHRVGPEYGPWGKELADMLERMLDGRYYLLALNELARQIYERNKRLGFYDTDKVRPFDGMLMNIVAEVAEAQEEWRNGRGVTETHYTFMDTNVGRDEPITRIINGKLHIRNGECSDPPPSWYTEWLELTPELLRNLPKAIPMFKPEGIPSELADIIIRVLDICAALGIDIAHAIADKMAYNETREYRHGGKRS